ncbi:hypothetical protein [Acinetobacter sp.]|uniref:hypothetical protein n=1 Tax=Acinetobacter sp. TaxID=472 RepID=UPI00388D9EFD
MAHQDQAAQVKQLAEKFNINEKRAARILEVLVEGAGNFSDEDYELMFTYYCNNAQIPYDIATSGDPYEWISDTLRAELGIV